MGSSALDCGRVTGPHKWELIVRELDSTLQEFQLRDKVLAVGTDNASNIATAIPEMGLRRVSCSAHTLKKG